MTPPETMRIGVKSLMQQYLHCLSGCETIRDVETITCLSSHHCLKGCETFYYLSHKELAQFLKIFVVFRARARPRIRDWGIV